MKPAPFLWICIVLFAFSDVHAAGTNAIRVISFEGTVEVLRSGSSRWDRVSTNLVLDPGDRIRTAEFSTAMLKMRDATDCRMRENSLFLIPAAESTRTLGRILRGWLYFFNRERPDEKAIESPGIATLIRGTEFAIHVDEHETTTVALIEGHVEMKNEHGRLELKSGEVGQGSVSSRPALTAVLQSMDASHIQWCLYYPAILHIDDIGFSTPDVTRLASVFEAYRAGDLLKAAELMPAPSDSDSAEVRLFRAGLILARGEPERAAREFKALSSHPVLGPLVSSLDSLVRAVQFKSDPAAAGMSSSGRTATELISRSYILQSLSDLGGALSAARAAAHKAPGMGFAWVRCAELEFSHGRLREAQLALDKGLRLSPRNAQAVTLHGFLLASRGQLIKARAAFDLAISLDPRLANGWLGRGLIKIRKGDLSGGREDLQTAAASEPQRALLRSYLAMVLHQSGDSLKAIHELELARQLDHRDPMPWLFAALMHEGENEINQAVKELTRSRELVAGRSVYRSAGLLNQDNSVRSANLASVYQDAGLMDFSLREASRAVDQDYSSHLAHLFLANSYDVLRDPRQVNLKYEAPAVREYLAANLLAPVSAGVLSPTISQNEYSVLLGPAGFGFTSSTEYRTAGDWVHSSSQFGTFDRMSYALDAGYFSSPGGQPNGDFQQLTLSLQLKLQVAPADVLYLQTQGSDLKSGDTAQLYDPNTSQRNLRRTERQDPMLLAGWHHFWSPGNSTLFLFGRITDETRFRGYSQPSYLLQKNPAGLINAVDSAAFPASYESNARLYTAELQQISTLQDFRLIGGVRAQTGEFEIADRLEQPVQAYGRILPGDFYDPADGRKGDPSFSRISSYSYVTWNVLENLSFTAGLSFDHQTVPVNHLFPPLTQVEITRNQWSPKGGISWSPFTNTTLHFAYARNLGGAGFDQSFSLEPTLVSGINQAFRSTIPESLVGSVTAPDMEIIGMGLDQSFVTGTYIGAGVQRIRSEVDRKDGAFSRTVVGSLPVFGLDLFEATQIRESLEMGEDSFSASIGQLIGRSFSVVGSVEWTRARLRSDLPDFPSAGLFTTEMVSTFRSVNLAGIWRSSRGPFAEARGSWITQMNSGPSPSMENEDFWKLDLYAGYRWPRKRAEIRVGLLNALGQDYRLSPLNWHEEWPRQRTVSLSFRFRL